MIFAAMYGYDPLTFFLYVLFTLIAVVIGLVSHEVAHGLVAKWNGDYTAKNMGRLSLNPIKHFDPIGFVMMMFVGFGYAKPVPINPGNFKNYRRGIITVSIAGIVMNLIVAFFAVMIGCLLYFGMYNVGSEKAFEALFYFAEMFRIISRVNLSLAFFNLLPIYPLDGFKLVEACTHRGNKYCAFMRTNGKYLLYGLVLLGIIVSMAFNYVSNIPYWFEYFDILGTYINICANAVTWVFTSFWGVIIHGYRQILLFLFIFRYGGIV
ncbi:MAG: site-2 protease family protein [Roseburia sp.]|nr:site-2 protease family protein [Roseburia sp.]